MNGDEREQEKKGGSDFGGVDAGLSLKDQERVSDFGGDPGSGGIDRAEKAVAATVDPREEAFEEINHEREYQDRRHMSSQFMSVGEELLLLRRYTDKAVEAWATFSGSAGDVMAMNDIRKIATIAVRAMENHGTIKREQIIEKMPIPAGEGAQIVEDGMREQDPTVIPEGGIREKDPTDTVKETSAGCGGSPKFSQ